MKPISHSDTSKVQREWNRQAGERLALGLSHDGTAGGGYSEILGPPGADAVQTNGTGDRLDAFWWILRMIPSSCIEACGDRQSIFDAFLGVAVQPFQGENMPESF
jgi:hypothetical protein